VDKKITATELARSLSDILNRVRYRGERFVVERNGEVIACLSPATPPKEMTWEKFIMGIRDLPQLDEDFAKDIEEIQASQGRLPPPPEWPS